PPAKCTRERSEASAEQARLGTAMKSEQFCGLKALWRCSNVFSSKGLELISITDSYAAAGVQSYHFTYPMAPTRSKPAWQLCAEIGSELLRSPKNQIS